jgi:hypothetical protein
LASKSQAGQHRQQLQSTRVQLRRALSGTKQGYGLLPAHHRDQDYLAGLDALEQAGHSFGQLTGGLFGNGRFPGLNRALKRRRGFQRELRDRRQPGGIDREVTPGRERRPSAVLNERQRGPGTKQAGQLNQQIEDFLFRFGSTEAPQGLVEGVGQLRPQRGPQLFGAARQLCGEGVLQRGGDLTEASVERGGEVFAPAGSQRLLDPRDVELPGGLHLIQRGGPLLFDEASQCRLAVVRGRNHLHDGD